MVTPLGSRRAPRAANEPSSMSSTMASSGRQSASWPDRSGSRCGMTGTPNSLAWWAMRRNGVMPPTRQMFGWTKSTAPASSRSRNCASV